MWPRGLIFNVRAHEEGAGSRSVRAAAGRSALVSEARGLYRYPKPQRGVGLGGVACFGWWLPGNDRWWSVMRVHMELEVGG